MSTLPTPTITATIEDRVKIKISGLTTPNASGYQLRWGTLSGGGRIDTIQTDTNGTYTLEDCRCRTTYFISARALGDDETYTNSDWSDEITIVTGQVVDTSIAAPNITLGTISYTYASFSGLAYDRGYRYQVAIDPLILESQPPKIAGNGATPGTFLLQGLRPNTTYYIRFCSTHPHQRCSIWSDVLSFTTTATNATATVTTANDSGEGSLRYIFENAAEGTLVTFDESLAGATINIGSTLTTVKWLIIDGSTLSTPITISLGSDGNKGFGGGQLTWFGIVYDGALVNSTNVCAVIGGSWVDCVFRNIQSTTTARSLSYAKFYRCTFSGCEGTNTGYLGENSRFDSCVFTGNSGALLNICGVFNCQINSNNTTTRRGCSACYIANTTILDNTGSQMGMVAHSSFMVESDVIGNINSVAGASMQGGLYNTALWDCRVENNQNTSNSVPFIGGATSTYSYDSIFRNNSSTSTYGVGTGNYIRCILDEPSNNAMTFQSPVFRDSLLLGRVTAGSQFGCTITYFNNTSTSGQTYNCLLGPSSTSPRNGNHNLIWEDADEIFIDAANRDYRLKVDSPVIGQGQNSVVTTDVDLAGNPRIAGETVDLGCYEFVPYQLNPPSYTLNILPGGQATISYTLPEYSSAFCFQYADNSDFTDAHEITSDTSTFDLQGLSGFLYIRTKAIGISGKTLDSEWTPVDDIYVDTIAPVVLVDSTPICMTYGETVNFLDGVSVTDDSPGPISLSYTLYDFESHIVEVDGQTIDVPSSRVPKGNYRLKITATDTWENEGTAERELSILPPKLQPPTITLKSIQGNTAIISGLLDSGASGWILSVDGTESVVTPNQGGQIPITALADGTHLVKVKAKGDFLDPDPPEQPTGDFRDSDWSNTLSITVGGEQPTGTPSIRQAAITDRTLTLAVDGLSDDLGYIEILLATKADFKDAILLTKLPKSNVVISGLKAATIYFVKVRGVYGDEKTEYSSVLVVETEQLQATSPNDKLLYIRSRIQLLRDYLGELGNLSSISIDGISETKIDRAQIRAELAELEAEESRLMAGGSRLRTIDARWVI